MSRYRFKFEIHIRRGYAVRFAALLLFPRVRLERFSTANKVGQSREGRTNNKRGDGKLVDGALLVERTTVRRCPGASGRQAAATTSIRQKLIPSLVVRSHCQLWKSRAYASLCCQMYLRTTRCRDCADPTNIYFGPVFWRPLFPMPERKIRRHNARDQVLHQARHQR